MTDNEYVAELTKYQELMRDIRNGKPPGKLFNDPPKKTEAPKPKKLYAREFG